MELWSSGFHEGPECAVVDDLKWPFALCDPMYELGTDKSSH